MPVISTSNWDRDTLARTVWGEARGGGAPAMENIASVVLNRLAKNWGHSIVGVCQAHDQFSCWNSQDPNRPKLLHITATDPAFRVAQQVATSACLGELHDATLGADSYYAISLLDPPFWARHPAVHTVTLWEHDFWIVRPPKPLSPIATGTPEYA